MKKFSHPFVAILLVLSPLGALAQGAPAKQNCDPKATLPNLQKAAATGGGYAVTKSTCIALSNVFARLFGASASAGKKLEQDKALNVAAATKERQDALADTDFSAALKDVLTGETDPLRRLLLEAALHEEYGNYAARDLLLRDVHALMEK